MLVQLVLKECKVSKVIKGDKGDKGEQGVAGKDGKGVNIKGSFPSVSNLPATGTQGDAYLVNGQLYVWTGSKWENVGNI